MAKAMIGLHRICAIQSKPFLSPPNMQAELSFILRDQQGYNCYSIDVSVSYVGLKYIISDEYTGCVMTSYLCNQKRLISLHTSDQVLQSLHEQSVGPAIHRVLIQDSCRAAKMCRRIRTLLPLYIQRAALSQWGSQIYTIYFFLAFHGNTCCCQRKYMYSIYSSSLPVNSLF